MLLLVLMLLGQPGETIWTVHDLIERGQIGDAVDVARAALAESPGDRGLRKALALALRNADELAAALELYDQLLAEAPDDDDARLGKAITLSWMERLDDAAATWDQVRPGTEERFEALLGIARVRSWQSRLDEALAAYARAEDLRPQSTETDMGRAQTLKWAGRYPQSIVVYEDIVGREPGNVDAWFGLGQTSEWAGFGTRARNAYRRAAELEPGRVEAADALARLNRELGLRIEAGVGYRAEDDAGTEGDYVDTRLEAGQWLGDYLRPSVRVQCSDNARGELRERYLLVGLGLDYRPWRPLTISGRVRPDVLSLSLPDWGGTARLELGMLTWTGTAGQVLFEPGSRLTAYDYSTGLRLRPFGGLSIAGRGAWLAVRDEPGNTKVSASGDASWEVWADPSVSLAYGYSFDSFRERSTRYYSPQDLHSHTVGLTAFKRVGRFYGTGELRVGLSTGGVQIIRAGVEVGVDLNENLALSAAGDFVQNNTGYANAGVRVGVTRVFPAR